MTPLVLIVEDEPVQRRLAAGVVAKTGWCVRECTGAGAALALLTDPAEREAIDVVLLDLMMPDGNGLAVLKALKANGLEVPVVVQTARTDLESVVEAMRAGAHDVLVKPVFPERLLAALEGARTSRRRVDPREAAREEDAADTPSPHPRRIPALAPDLAMEHLEILDREGEIRTLDAIEDDLIEIAMARYGGRPAEVARRIGIGRSTLYRKLLRRRHDPEH